MPADLGENLMNNLPRGIVHYVMANNECRPFLITRTWNNEMVNGTLFIDGRNDYLNIPFWIQPTGMSPNESVLTVWKTSIHFSGNNVINTWHYPEAA